MGPQCPKCNRAPAALLFTQWHPCDRCHGGASAPAKGIPDPALVRCGLHWKPWSDHTIRLREHVRQELARGQGWTVWGGQPVFWVWDPAEHVPVAAWHPKFGSERLPVVGTRYSKPLLSWEVVVREPDGEEVGSSSLYHQLYDTGQGDWLVKW